MILRGPVVTRKNAGGSLNDDSARLAAVIWTVTATVQMAGLNILTWLTAYLDECGRNGGKPLTGPALERFLLWRASPEDLRTWAQPPPPDKNPDNHARTAAATIIAAANPSCQFTGLPNTYRTITAVSIVGEGDHASVIARRDCPTPLPPLGRPR